MSLPPAVLAEALDHDNVWYLLLDQYGHRPQGYVGFRTTDLTNGRWEPIPPDQFHMPSNTKHGGVLPLRGNEWQRVREAYTQGKAPA